MVSVWYKPEHRPAEVIDRFSTRAEAERMAYEYALAFGCHPGQYRAGKDTVWAGRRDEQPN